MLLIQKNNLNIYLLCIYVISIKFIIRSICKSVVKKFENNLKIFRSYKYVAKIDGIHNLVDIWEFNACVVFNDAFIGLWI